MISRGRSLAAILIVFCILAPFVNALNDYGNGKVKDQRQFHRQPNVVRIQPSIRRLNDVNVNLRPLHSDVAASSVIGIPPGNLFILYLITFIDSVCSSDTSCAGYPLAYCDGTCKCREGALNAGSACIPNQEEPTTASCPAGQSYVQEVGTCLAGKVELL